MMPLLTALTWSDIGGAVKQNLARVITGHPLSATEFKRMSKSIFTFPSSVNILSSPFVRSLLVFSNILPRFKRHLSVLLCTGLQDLEHFQYEDFVFVPPATMREVLSDLATKLPKFDSIFTRLVEKFTMEHEFVDLVAPCVASISISNLPRFASYYQFYQTTSPSFNKSWFKNEIEGIWFFDYLINLSLCEN